MDLTIIWAAGVITKERIMFLRLIGGAAAGAFMYILTLYRPYISGFIQILVIIFSILLSVILAYRPKNFIKTIRLTSLSIILSFILAGLNFAFICIRSYFKIYSANILELFNYKLLIMSIVAFYFLIKYGGKALKKVGTQTCFTIHICYNENKYTLRALADTGNSLKDNIGNNHIIIAELELFKEIIDVDEIEDPIIVFKQLSETNLKNRIRLLPFKSIGNDDGILLGIKFDRAAIEYKSDIIIKNNIIVALYDGKLDSSGNFNSLTNYDIIL